MCSNSNKKKKARWPGFKTNTILAIIQRYKTCLGETCKTQLAWSEKVCSFCEPEESPWHFCSKLGPFNEKCFRLEAKKYMIPGKLRSFKEQQSPCHQEMTKWLWNVVVTKSDPESMNSHCGSGQAREVLATLIVFYHREWQICDIIIW